MCMTNSRTKMCTLQQSNWDNAGDPKRSPVVPNPLSKKCCSAMFFPLRLMSKTCPGSIKWKHEFFFRWNVEKDWFLKLLEMHVCLSLFCFLSYFQIIYSLFVYQKKIKFFPQEEFVLLLAGGHLYIKVNCQIQKKI